MNCVSCALGFMKGYNIQHSGCYERAGLSFDGSSECYYARDGSSTETYCMHNAPEKESSFDILIDE